MQLPEGSRHYLLAPVVRGRKGEYRKELAEWQKAGFTRVRIDGEFYAIEDAPALDKKYKHDIEVVVDRIVDPRRHRAAPRRQLRDRAEARRGPRLPRSGRPAGRPAGGRATGSRRGAGEGRRAPVLATTPPAASSSPRNSPARSAASPSPRSSRGCSASTRRRAPAPPATASARSWCSTRTSSSPTTPFDQEGRGRPLGQVQPAHALLHAGAARASPAPTTSTSTRRGRDLPEEARRRHPPRHRRPPRHPPLHRRPRSYEVKKPFEGVIGNLNRRMLQTESAWMREELSRYQAQPPVRGLPRRPPPPEALAVKIAGEDISHVHPPQRRRRLRLVRAARTRSSPRTQHEIAKAILKEINERLGFLHNVGLDYLHLDRTSGTLSGGESQRIRLAVADRLRPLGRPLRPRRALDRPPPEGQRPPPRNAEAPQVARQHRARRRA